MSIIDAGCSVRQKFATPPCCAVSAAAVLLPAFCLGQNPLAGLEVGTPNLPAHTCFLLPGSSAVHSDLTALLSELKTQAFGLLSAEQPLTQDDWKNQTLTWLDVKSVYRMERSLHHTRLRASLLHVMHWRLAGHKSCACCYCPWDQPFA